MTLEKESIIGQLENLLFSRGGSLFRCDIIFTNKALYFVKTAGGAWMGLLGPIVEIFIGQTFSKKNRLKMKNMSLSRMLTNNKENFRLTKDELNNIEIKRGSVLTRSRVYVKKDGKKRQLSFDKREDIDMFLTLLERVKAAP
jgi:hypothetical protein